jgi:hypothetical protein
MAVYQITIDTDTDARHLRALLSDVGEVIEIVTWEEGEEE